MGSATRQALAETTAALGDLGHRPTPQLADGLFQAARVLGESAQLRAVLADPDADGAAKDRLLSRVFGQLPADALTVLRQACGQRWSNPDDLLAGVEQLGIRAATIAAPADVSVESELFAFGAAVTSDPELELALGSKLGDANRKLGLLDSLLTGKASGATVAIARQLVLQPRGRSLRQALHQAESIVAAQNGRTVATVSTATHLQQGQVDRLATALGKQYGGTIKINQVLDPSLVGGVRVQIGDDVIDGSVERRLADLRRQLVG